VGGCAASGALFPEFERTVHANPNRCETARSERSGVTAADVCRSHVLQPLVGSSIVPAYLVLMSRDPQTIFEECSRLCSLNETVSWTLSHRRWSQCCCVACPTSVNVSKIMNCPLSVYEFCQSMITPRHQVHLCHF